MRCIYPLAGIGAAVLNALIREGVAFVPDGIIAELFVQVFGIVAGTDVEKNKGGNNDEQEIHTERFQQ